MQFYQLAAQKRPPFCLAEKKCDILVGDPPFRWMLLRPEKTHMRPRVGRWKRRGVAGSNFVFVWRCQRHQTNILPAIKWWKFFFFFFLKNRKSLFVNRAVIGPNGTGREGGQSQVNCDLFTICDDGRCRTCANGMTQASGSRNLVKGWAG